MSNRMGCRVQTWPTARKMSPVDDMNWIMKIIVEIFRSFSRPNCYISSNVNSIMNMKEKTVTAMAQILTCVQMNSRQMLGSIVSSIWHDAMRGDSWRSNFECIRRSYLRQYLPVGKMTTILFHCRYLSMLLEDGTWGLTRWNNDTYEDKTEENGMFSSA